MYAYAPNKMYAYALLFLLFTIGFLNGERLYENVNYFEGDMMLTPEERLNIYKPYSTYGASKKKWPGKTFYYEFADTIEKEIGAKQAIYEALNEFHRLTCLKFVRRTTEKDYIEFYNGQGCGATVGYRRGKNKISLQGPGCWSKGTIIHEIMHNLGFYHEQSRPDRDKYVEILWDNISSKDMWSNFQKQPPSNVDSLGSKYDYLSIMHYHKDGFAKRGKITIRTLDASYQDKIGQRKTFSASDLKQLNTLYNCGDKFQTSRPITSIHPVCKDVNTNCDFFARYCKDRTWFDFMNRECKFTCSFCGKQSTTKPTRASTRPTGTTANCEDVPGRTCHDFKNRGYCKTLEYYMRKNCKKTCNFC